MIALAAAAVLALAAASPSPAPAAKHPTQHAVARPAAATALRAVPSPEPSNPFTLAPDPVRSSLPLPYIGGTKARAVCTALRQAVAPAVVAAMKNDKTYDDLRKGIYDYTVFGTESSREMKLMRMDRNVQTMVKTVDAMEKALDAHALDVPANASSTDAQAITGMKQTLHNVLEAQKGQLDLMSGFVETERMRIFGQPTEGELAMRSAISPETSIGQQKFGQLATPAPSNAFLRDSSVIMKNAPGTISLNQAQNLDRDLGDVAAYTAKREDAASKAIIPATNLCR